MLVSKTAMVKWNGYTKRHYEERGYVWTKRNDLFECKIEDLMLSSTVRVEVKCDYCVEGVAHKEYRKYLKENEIVNKDCCKNRKCMVAKSEEVCMKLYGVKNKSQLNEYKEKARKLFQTPKEDVLEVAKSKGVKILNIEEYQNDRTRLFIVCEKHFDKGKQETNFANIRKNKHCCKYIRPEITSEVKKLDGKIVYDEFISNGLIPLFEPSDYEGNDKPLPYKCPKHLDKGTQYRMYSNLKYTEGCLHCSDERTNSALRNSEDEVFSYFKERGLIVLDGQRYINKDSHILYKCPNHIEYEQKCTLSSLKKTKIPCEYCRIESSLSSLNRKLRSSIGEWKYESERISSFKCVLTNSTNYEVHHLYSFNSIIKDSLNLLGIEIKNKYSANEFKLTKEKVIELHKVYIGVCLRPDLHILFHQIYGKHDNTPEQFEEFKKRYIKGEFNNLLEEVV